MINWTCFALIFKSWWFHSKVATMLRAKKRIKLNKRNKSSRRLNIRRYKFIKSYSLIYMNKTYLPPKEKKKKRNIDKVIIMVDDFKILLSVFNKTSKQKVRKDLIKAISQSQLIFIEYYM